MTPVFDLGGHRLTVTQDRYPDGRPCFVAEHPDLPGCIAYGDTSEAAMTALKEARAAHEQSVRRHEGGKTPRAFPKIVDSSFSDQVQFA